MSILQLPEEILLKIFNYLTLDDLCNCYFVTEKWQKVSGDMLLWKSKLVLESDKWVGILPKENFKLNEYTHPKDVYQSLTPIYCLSNEFISNGIFSYFKFFVKSYMGYKSPNIATMGSGLDNYRTGKFFGSIFHNSCLEFEPIGQFVLAVGSGVTMKLKSDDNYPYKFHFYLLHACRPQSKFSESGSQELRIKESALFNKLQLNQSLSELTMLNAVKDIFNGLNGLIYSIDAQTSSQDYQSLICEFNIATKNLKKDVPILILLIRNLKEAENVELLSSYQVAEIFSLSNLKHPWCILTASVKEIHVLRLGLMWLIQKIFKM